MKSRRRVNSSVMLLRLSLTVALLTLSCSHAQTTSRPSQQIIATASPTPTVQPTSGATAPNQPIRSIDFCAVAFPHYPEFVGDRGRKKYVTLQPGDRCPAQLDYGD